MLGKRKRKRKKDSKTKARSRTKASGSNEMCRDGLLSARREICENKRKRSAKEGKCIRTVRRRKNVGYSDRRRSVAQIFQTTRTIKSEAEAH